MSIILSCLIMLSVGWTSIHADSKDKEILAPRLREVVVSLQEQLSTLQKEQEANRMVIRALESRLDEELSTKNRRKQRQQQQTPVTDPEADDSLAERTELRSKPRNSFETKESLLGRLDRKSMVSKRSQFGRVDFGDMRTTVKTTTTTTTTTTTPSSKRPEQYHENTTVPPTPENRNPVQDCAPECENFQIQLESLGEEIQKLRLETESQKMVHENQESQISELKNGHITTKWLQKTVVDLRKELSELAAALNISMALRESQHLENMLDRVRGDIVSLRAEVDHKSAGMSRQAAALEEIREELHELRAMASTVIADHQHMVDEVTALKEELFRGDSDSSSPDMWPEEAGTSNVPSEGSGDDGLIGESELIRVNEPLGSQDSGHHHLSTEVASIRNSLQRLHHGQSLLEQEIETLRRNHSLSQLALNNVQRTMTRLDNANSAMYGEQTVLAKTLDDIREKLNLAEEKALRNSRNIVNITEAMTGMDKVHSSTIQLFEALESLEDEYSKSIGDLQKEVSKFEFNVAQVQGSFDILRHDQSSQYEDLKALKGDFSSLQRDFRKDHYRLTSIQNEFLNRSLQRCAEEGQETLQDLKLANLELQIAKLTRKDEDHKMNANMMYSKLMQKVDRNALQAMEQSHRGLADELRNLSAALPNITEVQDQLRHELMKFIKRLPSDCSMSDIPESAGQYNSGIYLVHVPHSHHAKEMYCDMSTDGERWTVIQRRVDGSEDFFRNWADYKKGFGNPSGEFWAGNEAIHRLTNHRDYTLRIDMWDVFNRYIYAEYENFKISSEDDEYRLEVGNYSGNASDSLKHHHNMAFSTHDRDNDASSTHCAMYYSAGWWYQHCQYVNVNGRYAIGMTWYDANNKDWVQLAKVEMKIQATTNS